MDALLFVRTTNHKLNYYKGLVEYKSWERNEPLPHRKVGACPQNGEAGELHFPFCSCGGGDLWLRSRHWEVELPALLKE